MNHLQLTEGRIAYEVDGDGPLVVCIPGMGDLRTTYRLMAPALVAAGNRVALMDLRGHGDSDPTFASYDDAATAADVEALLEELGEPAVLVGNSMGAGAAVILAGRRPDLVRGLVLLGGFVRDPSVSALETAVFRTLMLPLWARPVWKGYLPKLYAGRKPTDHKAYLASVAAALKLPGRTKAFSRTTHTTHAPAEAALPSVKAPTLVMTGVLDPDWKDPAAEAAWVGAQLHAEVVVVPECGHYPQSQRPDVVVPAVLQFLASLDA